MPGQHTGPTGPLTEDQIVEIGARAECAKCFDDVKWNDLAEDAREHWRIRVRAIFAALRSAGYAIAPVEPTEAMVDAGDFAIAAITECAYNYDAEAAAAYRAMLAAATED